MENEKDQDTEKKIYISSSSSSSSSSFEDNENNNTKNDYLMNSVEYIHYKNQLNELIILKDYLKKQIIEYNNSYKLMDEIFSKEIKKSMNYNNFLFITISPCCYFHEKINIEPYKKNKIIYDTLQDIIG